MVDRCKGRATNHDNFDVSSSVFHSTRDRRQSRNILFQATRPQLFRAVRVVKEMKIFQRLVSISQPSKEQLKHIKINHFLRIPRRKTGLCEIDFSFRFGFSYNKLLLVWQKKAWFCFDCKI